MGLTTEEIVAKFDKKYKKYEAAEKFMDTLQENGFEMDEFIQEQLKCIKDVKIMESREKIAFIDFMNVLMQLVTIELGKIQINIRTRKLVLIK